MKSFDELENEATKERIEEEDADIKFLITETQRIINNLQEKLKSEEDYYLRLTKMPRKKLVEESKGIRGGRRRNTLTGGNKQ